MQAGAPDLEPVLCHRNRWVCIACRSQELITWTCHCSASAQDQPTDSLKCLWPRGALATEMVTSLEASLSNYTNGPKCQTPKCQTLHTAFARPNKPPATAGAHSHHQFAFAQIKLWQQTPACVHMAESSWVCIAPTHCTDTAIGAGSDIDLAGTISTSRFDTSCIFSLSCN